MNRKEVEQLIQDENLNGKNFFNSKNATFEDAIIEYENKQWNVYIFGERGSKEGLSIYDNELEALLDYIERLRAEKKIVEYRENRKQR